MRRKSKLTIPTLLNLYKIFLGLAILEGLLAMWFLFRIPSAAGNAILAGYSLQRFGIGFVILFICAILIFLLIDSLTSHQSLKFLVPRLEAFLSTDGNRTFFKSSLIIVLTTSLITILFFLLPPLQRLHPFLHDSYIFTSIGDRAGLLIGWIFLISLKIFILYTISGRNANLTVFTPVRLMIISWTIEIFVILYFALWSLIRKNLELEILRGPGVKILILSVWFTLWYLLSRQKERAKRIFLLFSCISIWLCVFIISLQFAQWFDRWYTPERNYFNYLASSFIHGQLFLPNPPDTFDLTLYHGHWFVPQPPIPAILMLPFIAIWGIKAFNTTTFSLALAATIAVTLYLILYRLIQLGWIKLSRSGAIWLTALFCFGTPLWWLSIDSRVFYYSQLVTVLFCTLAFLAALEGSSPLLTGTCLAAAIMTRPNVFLLWPALLTIMIQLHSKEKEVIWKDVLRLGTLSAIPVILGVFLLLYYNFLRFGNFFDFGYVTINDPSWIVQNAQQYGLFSPRFIPENLYWMLLAAPRLTAQCAYFLQRGMGMSIFATTPAIIYLLRKFKISWWTIGCWCSILLSIILLSMYSNNGSQQYGYRYMMDFSVPAIMLIAFNAGKRISVPLKILIIASILINYYGTISWFRGPC